MTTYAVNEIVRKTGYPKTLVDKKIFCGDIETKDNLVVEATMERILREKDQYISLVEFAKLQDKGTFNGSLSKDRRKLIDYLEKLDYFGLETVEPEDILMGTKIDFVYFLRKDIPVLELQLSGFFKDFGVPVEQIVKDMLTRNSSTHKNTCDLLQRFLSDTMPEANGYPPSVAEFVSIMLSLPDISIVETSDISAAIQQKMTCRCKEHMVQFLNYCKKKSTVRYKEIVIKQVPRNAIPAYTDEQYIALMHCIFNADYIAQHEMVEKALGNHLYAEMWLFLSLFLVCGWRAGDICVGWQYPCLATKEDLFPEINRRTLREDILCDQIPDAIYEDVCTYSMGAVAAANILPSKTAMRNPTTLKIIITPVLRTFYGLLTLISEVHMMEIGDGYMVKSRTPEYQNKVNLRAFFGPEMLLPLNGENIQSRRLNKDYLQGVEKSARENGANGLLASSVASYARNHKSTETITHYLKDHNLNGETAEMVVYYMLERGILGFEYYKTILLAYPDAFRRLPLREQNRLIAIMDESSLALEIGQSGLLAGVEVREAFAKAIAKGARDGAVNYKMVSNMLKSMLEISQARGKAKDEGIGCLKRAQGEACCFPEYGSCLANACPHLVFTRNGIIPLTKILVDYMGKAKKDRKASSVLNQILIPKFQSVINSIMKDMTECDRKGVRNLIETVLKEG